MFSEPIFGSLVAITAKFYAKNLHFSIDLSSGCLQFWGRNKNMDFYEFRLFYLRAERIASLWIILALDPYAKGPFKLLVLG